VSLRYRRNAARKLTLDEKVALQERALQGSNARHLYQFASEVLVDQIESRVRARIFDRLDSAKPLTAEEAIQAWVEVRSAHRLVSQLERVAIQGESASRKLASPSENQK